MLDATQLSYLTIVRWDNPPAKWENPPADNLGEKLSCSTTLSSEQVDDMPAAALLDSLVWHAREAWRYKIEKRMGCPPPADARLAVTLLLDAATGKPVAHLCTLVENEADEPKPEDNPQ